MNNPNNKRKNNNKCINCGINCDIYDKKGIIFFKECSHYLCPFCIGLILIIKKSYDDIKIINNIIIECPCKNKNSKNQLNLEFFIKDLNNISTTLININNFKCFEHNKELNSFCIECSEILCDICIINHNKNNLNHKLITQTYFDNKIKNKINEMNFKNYESFKNNFISKQFDFENNYNNVTKELFKKIDNIINIFNNIKNNINFYYNFYSNFFKIINKVYEYFYKNLNNIQAFNFINKINFEFNSFILTNNEKEINIFNEIDLFINKYNNNKNYLPLKAFKIFNFNQKFNLFGGDFTHFTKFSLNKKIECSPFQVNSIIQLKNYNIVISLNNPEKETIYIYDSEKYKFINKLEGEKNVLLSDLKEYENNFIITSNFNNNKIKLWSTNELHKSYIESFEAHVKPTISLFYDFNKKLLFTGSFDGEIGIWDLKNHKNVFLIKSHQNKINCFLALKNNDLIFLSGSDDCFIKIYDIINNNKLKEKASLFKIFGKVKKMIQLKEKNILCSIDNLCEINLWDLRNKILIRSFKAHEHEIIDVIKIRYGNILTVSLDKNIRIFEIKEEGRKVKCSNTFNSINQKTKKNNNVFKLLQLKDKKIITAGDDIEIWN